MHAGMRRERGRRIASSMILACSAMPAFGQETVPPLVRLERIEVTGSNITRAEGESGLPLQVITRQQLDDGGVQSVQDLLDRISANQSFGGFNEARGLGNSRVGYTAASLRGLGAERTLILMNGRRLAPYALSGGQSVDLSGIPPSALERVEILKDGASAIYGTDAVAGVINFILRRDFQGAEIYSNYFGTEQGGGNNWRANATLGYGDLAKDKFNFFVSADHFRQDSLKASQRQFSKTSYIPALGLDHTAQGSLPANILLDPTTLLIVNPTIPYPGGATPTSCLPPLSFPTQGSPFTCQFDVPSVSDAIPESEKTNAIGRFTWQIDANNQLFAEATYYRGTFIQRISPTPVYFPPFTNNDTSLPPTSPHYPAAFVTSAGGDPTQPLPLLYRSVELGPRTDEAKVDQWTFVAGAQGTFHGWDYQLSGNWVQNRQRDYLKGGWISDARFSALLRSGIVNPFGFNTEVVLEQMRATQIIAPANDNKASNYGGDFKLGRSLLDLPAGPLALALGVEGRRESLEQTNSDFVVSGDILGYGGGLPSLASAHRTVWALFGEVNAPITESVEANVAIRYDHYSDFGGTTNPKFTLRWQANRSLVLRSAYGTGFRAPTLSDLFLPLAANLAGDVFDDPVRCPVTNSLYDCGKTYNALPYQTRAGGNPLLQPEMSRQWNAGIVWQPVREFAATVDYYWVEVRNLVLPAPASTIFDNYAALAPTQVIRKPPDTRFPNLPGEIDYLIEQPINIGTLRTSGIDLEATYRSPVTPIGAFTAGITGTYVIDYALTGANSMEFPGSAGSRGTAGAISRWRHYATLDWTRGAWGATLANTFQNGFSEPCEILDPSGCATRRVGSYSIWDLQGRYSGLRNLTFTLGVRNLMNTPPPVTNQLASFQVSYDPLYADARGRMYYGALRYTYK